MAKKYNYEEKKARIQELLNMQKETEDELRSLLDPEPVAIPPAGFSISTEVMKLVQQAGTKGISSQEILQNLQKNFPAYGIDRERVSSALAYAKNNKKSIEITNRGIYRMKTETTPVQESG